MSVFNEKYQPEYEKKEVMRGGFSIIKWMAYLKKAQPRGKRAEFFEKLDALFIVKLKYTHNETITFFNMSYL